MSRSLLLLLILLVVIVGGMIYLAGRNTERPQTTVEKAVPLENLQN
ncbi:uncharacterized protein (UPF0333 family) [Stakelama sediminis]|uniref:Uncharacterized protein (UPF0333 family) n=1 Tax=Stakelama sediminis TaxID=463200 RepID=A0A840YWC2_9SPHN|nr:hypothetical protein [Stakelama sediminis]MBB5717933.1 uncharacterized protein (UPF0333 family) [Stakelama sediminis]